METLKNAKDLEDLNRDEHICIIQYIELCS